MDVLYPYEHLSCRNYESKKKKPTIEIVDLSIESVHNMLLEESMIVFLLQGEIQLSYGRINNVIVSEPHFFVLPTGSTVHIVAREASRLLSFHVRQGIQICDEFPLEKLYPGGHVAVDTVIQEESLGELRINHKISPYLSNLIDSIEGGLTCKWYFDLKIKELFYLLRAYYTKESLSLFFRPILIHDDAAFVDFVWKHYRKARSVQDLAELSSYSLSTFKAKFRKTFDLSPAEWLTTQKAKNVYHELTKTDKAIKQISSDYHFSSEAHMSLFCRKKLGDTPGQIRKKSKFN